MSESHTKMNDADLLFWAKNFAQRIDTNYDSFHLTIDDAASFNARAQAFDAAMTAWREPITRTPIALARKQSTRGAVLDLARFLVATVNNNPLTTDEQRDELGIRARRRPTPSPVPTAAPNVTATLVGPSSARLIAADPADPYRRAKPAGVRSILTQTHFGDHPPADAADWSLSELSSRATIDLTWPDRAAATTVWFQCCYVGTRNERGPMSQPACVRLPGPAIGPTPVAATEGGSAMKIAA